MSTEKFHLTIPVSPNPKLLPKRRRRRFSNFRDAASTVHEASSTKCNSVYRYKRQNVQARLDSCSIRVPSQFAPKQRQSPCSFFLPSPPFFFSPRFPDDFPGSRQLSMKKRVSSSRSADSRRFSISGHRQRGGDELGHRATNCKPHQRSRRPSFSPFCFVPRSSSRYLSSASLSRREEKACAAHRRTTPPFRNTPFVIPLQGDRELLNTFPLAAANNRAESRDRGRSASWKHYVIPIVHRGTGNLCYQLGSGVFRWEICIEIRN